MNHFPWGQSGESNLSRSALFHLLCAIIPSAQSEAGTTLQLNLAEHIYKLSIKNGSVVGLQGFQDALSPLGIVGDRDCTMDELIGQAMAQGGDFLEVISLTTSHLELFLAQLRVDQEVTSMLLPYESLGMELNFSKSVLQMLIASLELLTDDQLLAQMLPLMRHQVCPPECSVEGQRQYDQVLSMIPPASRRLLEKIGNGKRMSRIVDNSMVVGEDWRKVDLLRAFGLITVTENARAPRVIVEDPFDIECREKLTELNEILALTLTQRPEQILRITNPSDINPDAIASKFRLLSREFHPDQFVVLREEVRNKAQELYTVINDAHQALQDSTTYPELIARLEAERRGEVYVSPQATQKAELLTAKAQFFLRKRRFAETKELVSEALELNPYDWRSIFVSIQALVGLNELTKFEGAEQLKVMSGMNTVERTKVLFTAVEWYYQVDEIEKSKELVRNILEVDNTHIGARRYLQRFQRAQGQDQVSSAERADGTESKKKSFLSGFFGKK